MAERCNFVVGQRVVCVLKPIMDRRCPFALPEKGSIYSIREIIAEGDDVFLVLAEIHHRVWCLHEGFKPIDERRTDISVFTEILRKVNDGAPVDAFADCSAWC